MAYLTLHSLLAGRHWLMNIVSIIPSLVYPIISVAIGVFALKRDFSRLDVVLFVLTLVISFSLSDVRVGWPRAMQASEKVITVFNWNTHFWADQKDNEDLYRFLREQKADVYHLQEAYVPLDVNFKEYGPILDLDVLQERFVDYEVVYEGEFITMSRYKVVGHSLSGSQKYLRTEIEIDGEIVVFYNVHFTSQVNFEQAKANFSLPKLIQGARENWHKREMEFGELVEDLERSEGGFYVSGDFNTTSAMGKMGQVKQLANNSFDRSNRLVQNTWVLDGLRLHKFDYNFASKSMTIVEHEDIDPENRSDHWGQSVSVELQTQL